MDNYLLYLCGGMSNLSHEEQSKWRWEVINRINEEDEYYGYKYKPDFFNPMVYYNLEEEQHKSEREPFLFDLYNLRKSDLVIANFNMPSSIGSAMEIAIAFENEIPIIGLNEDGKDIHPWLEESCIRICDSMDELIEHVALYYLT